MSAVSTVLQAMIYVAMGANLVRRTLPVIFQTGSNARILLQKKQDKGFSNLPGC